MKNEVFESKARHKEHLVQKDVALFADRVRLTPFGHELCVLRVVTSCWLTLIRLGHIRLENLDGAGPDEAYPGRRRQNKDEQGLCNPHLCRRMHFFEMPLRG